MKAVASAEFVDDIILLAHHINDAIRASSKQPGETAIRRVLQPRYVSTVDSGNLLASLWTFETSCNELAARPLVDVDALSGIADTLGVMRQIGVTMKEAERAPAFLRLVELTTGHAVNLEEIILRLREGSPGRAGSTPFLPGPRNRSARLLGATSRQAGRGLEYRH